MEKRPIASDWLQALALALAAALAACDGGGAAPIKLKVDPPTVAKDGQAEISATLLKDVKQDVDLNFEMSDGRDCGELEPKSAKTDDHGFAQVVFKPWPTVATRCEATIKVTRGGEAADSGGKGVPVTAAQAPITVVPTLEGVTIEATAAITIILVASFAIDRIVSTLLFLVRRGGKAAYLPPPDTEESRAILESERRNEKLVYVALAGLLGLALGYFGKIRILEGLGFTKNVPINVILTALILTAGSDSISALLKRMGGGSAVAESEPKPLEVRGNLVLARPSGSAGSGGSAGRPAGEESSRGAQPGGDRSG